MQREPEKAKAQLAYVPDFPFLYDKLTARNSCNSSAISSASTEGDHRAADR